MDIEKDSKQLRETIERFKTRFKINESYTFQQHDNSSKREEAIPERNEEHSNSDENVGNGIDIKEKVKQIRSLALNLLSELSPDINADECKTLDAINIACGKLLAPKAASIKPIAAE